jgi:hypothetical protein
VTVHINETFPFEDGSCTSTASKSFDANTHGHFVLLWLGGNILYFSGEQDGFDPPLIVTVTSECTSSSGSYTFIQDSEFFNPPWFRTGPDLWPIAFGATTISESYSTTDSGDDQQWSWNFVKEQEQ